MLGFILALPRWEIQEPREKKNQNENMSPVGIEPANPRFASSYLRLLSHTQSDEDVCLEVFY